MPRGIASKAEIIVTIKVPIIIGKIPPSVIPFFGAEKIKSKLSVPIEFFTRIVIMVIKNTAMKATEENSRK